MTTEPIVDPLPADAPGGGVDLAGRADEPSAEMVGLIAGVRALVGVLAARGALPWITASETVTHAAGDLVTLDDWHDFAADALEAELVAAVRLLQEIIRNTRCGGGFHTVPPGHGTCPCERCGNILEFPDPGERDRRENAPPADDSPDEHAADGEVLTMAADRTLAVAPGRMAASHAEEKGP